MATGGPDQKDAFRQLEERDVRFINILFTDLPGELKSVETPLSQFEDALDAGISFDGSSIRGYADVANADMYLKPDLTTLKIYPWFTPFGDQPEKYAAAGVIADVYTTEGELSIRSPRYILRHFLQKPSERGYEFFVAVEPEFFLFPKGEIPATRSEVTGKAGYFALVPADVEETVRKAIVSSLLEMDIAVEKSHHEIEPYINELSFKYADPVTTADRLMVVKFVAKSVAAQYGFQAVFMPKPIARFAASGMHVHFSMFKEGKNAFYDQEDEMGLSAHARFFIGGLIEHISAVTALTNPYLAFTAILAGGMDGIESSIEPPAAVEENIYRMSGEEKAKRGIAPLPHSLEQTIRELETDKVISQAIGPEVTAYLIRAKREEIAAFNQFVTDWERQQYLDV